MVFAKSCAVPEKLGTGIVVPTRAECCEPEDLFEEAELLWAAERNSEELGGLCAEWGKVCVLKNPNATIPGRILQAWEAKVKALSTFYTTLPCANGEDPVLDPKNGHALFDWPTDCEIGEALGGLDMLLMTTSKPTLQDGRYPAPKEIAKAWLTDEGDNVMYFYNNRHFGISTFEDEEIRTALQADRQTSEQVPPEPSNRSEESNEP